jgi:hypothetical protein
MYGSSIFVLFDSNLLNMNYMYVCMFHAVVFLGRPGDGWGCYIHALEFFMVKSGQTLVLNSSTLRMTCTSMRWPDKYITKNFL